MEWIFDTNIWIYLFQGRNELLPLKKEILDKRVTPVLVPVVYAEVLGWNEIKPEQESDIRDYFSTLEMLDLKMEHWEQVITWRKNGFTKKLPDLLIASFSRLNKIPIYTHNIKDFSRLGIEFEDPWTVSV
jgi:predicted nucleic acid-binding protein